MKPRIRLRWMGHAYWIEERVTRLWWKVWVPAVGGGCAIGAWVPDQFKSHEQAFAAMRERGWI